MKVRLKSNFDLGAEVLEVEGHSVTLRELLERLSRIGQGFDFINPRTGEVDDFVVVSVNGREHDFIPGRLEALLAEGDEVGIAVQSFGGG